MGGGDLVGGHTGQEHGRDLLGIEWAVAGEATTNEVEGRAHTEQLKPSDRLTHGGGIGLGNVAVSPATILASADGGTSFTVRYAD
jgi:hypothetical protein